MTAESDLIAEVAARHPQNGVACMWCRVFMSSGILRDPADVEHMASCVWLRANAVKENG